MVSERALLESPSDDYFDPSGVRNGTRCVRCEARAWCDPLHVTPPAHRLYVCIFNEPTSSTEENHRENEKHKGWGRAEARRRRERVLETMTESSVTRSAGLSDWTLQQLCFSIYIYTLERLTDSYYRHTHTHTLHCVLRNAARSAGKNNVMMLRCLKQRASNYLLGAFNFHDTLGMQSKCTTDFTAQICVKCGIDW
jgi:hypothetical protein